MTTNVALKLPKKVQKNLIAFANMRYASFGISTYRERFEKIDKAIQLESDNRREKIPDYFDDVEQPLVAGPTSTVANFLIDTFVNNQHLFEVVAPDPTNAEGADQMNAINEENSKRSNWTREFLLFFRNMPKYNYGAMELLWEIEPILSLTTDAVNGSNTGAAVEASTRQGNVFHSWDPYNTFYDTSVDVNQVHAKGEFAGTVERVSMIELQSRIDKLKLAGRHLMNIDKIWSVGSSAPTHYYTPAVRTEVSASKQDNGWLGFFGETPDMVGSERRSLSFMYEYVTMYVRIIPKMFGASTPGADKIQIWKLHIVGWDTLIYAEKQNNAHGFFPSVFVQLDEQNIQDQVKSLAEKLIPMQNLSTKLYDSRLASIVRAIGDRALYDGGRIEKRHLDSDNPKAKIPVKPNILNPGLSNAYASIPFNDNISQTFLQELGFLDQRANKTSGLNNPQQGQLQKGNRTLGEFNEVMANADDDLRTWGKLVQAQAMTPLKQILKTNILQYQPPTTIVPDNGQVQQQIDPVTLRKAAIGFKVADNLVTKEAILDMPTARSFFELLLQSPQLQQFYGERLPDLVDHVFSTMGFNTRDFRSQQQPQGQAPQGQPPAAQQPAAQQGTPA